VDHDKRQGKYGTANNSMTMLLSFPLQPVNSFVVLNAKRVLIAHGGLHANKSFQDSTGFVLSVAPGVDYALVVALMLCLFDYQDRKKNRRRRTGMAAGPMSGGGGIGSIGGAIGGGGAGC
jgi:hypothetical protein